MNIPDEAAKGAPGAPPIVADLETRIEKDLGIKVDNLDDLNNPDLIAAAADHLCSDKSPTYGVPTPHFLENLGHLVSNSLKDGEIGKAPKDHLGRETAKWWSRLTEATFSHTQPFTLELAMELTRRCPVPTNPPPSFDEWKAHLKRATGTTDQEFYHNWNARRDLVVEAVDILLHTSPDTRSYMLENLIAEAKDAFSQLRDKESFLSRKRLEGWEVLDRTGDFSQEIVGNLVQRAKGSLSGPAADTKKKVRGALGEDEGKAA